MKRTRRASTALALSLLFGPSGAKVLPAQTENPRFEHLSLEQGLSQGTVQSMLQDRQGFMWFATLDGLNQYDGYGFVVYRLDPENPDSLSDSVIWDIHEDSAGVLWVATFNGLNRLDRATGRFTHYFHDPDDPESLSHNTVRSIYEDQSGGFWIGTDGGLNRLDRTTGRFTRYVHDPEAPESLSHDSVWSIYEDGARALWIGTVGGLNRMDRLDTEGVRFARYVHDRGDPGSLSHDEVRAISEDQNGALWVGTFDGLNRLEPSTDRFTRFLHDPDDPESLSHDTVWSIYRDTRGELWIGTDGGLNRLDDSTGLFTTSRHNPADPQSLNNNRVSSLFESRGILWVGTNGGGINKLDRTRKPFVHFRHDPNDPTSLSNNTVWALYQDRSGVLWIGTDGGLNRLDRKTGRFTHYRHDPDDRGSLRHNAVRAVYQDRSGLFWVGTYGGGLHRFEPESGRFTAYQHDPEDPHSLSDDRIRAILQDQAGTLWVGTFGGGINRFDSRSGRFTAYRHDPDDSDSLSDDTVTLLYEDRSGRLWVGTQRGGLDELDPQSGRFTAHRHHRDDPHSMSHSSISSIHHDRAGALWVGTYGGGLNRFDPRSGRAIRFREQDGLPNDVIYGILEDDDGNLWISTNKGLSRFNPTIEGDSAFRNFDIQDGLQSNEFNMNAWYKNASGEMFFGGMNGFNAFYPDRIQDNRHVPPVVLTGFRLFNEPVSAASPDDPSGRGSPLRKHISETEEIRLSHRDNVISFEFVALNYSSPERNQYAYRMEGFDEDWVYSGTRHDATYTNLDPGAYVFRVKGSNNDGIWNEEGASIRLIITPPFWATWWFRISTLSALAGLAWVGYRRRIDKLDTQKRELERVVAERTTDLSAANQQLTEEIQVRRRSAYALLQSEARFRSVAQSANEAIISADSQGRIVFWNHKAEIDFGYSPEEVMGQPLTILMPERYRDAHRKGLQRALKTGEVMGNVVELHGLRADGSEFPLELSLASWTVAEGTFFSGVIRDVTRRREAQARLQDMQNRLNVQERMASLGSLVAGVAHEMNSPLGVINSMNDTSVRALDKLKSALPETSPDEREARHSAQSVFEILDNAHRFIATGTERMTKIMRSLRGFARLDEAEFQLTDLHEGIESTLTLLQSQLVEGITVVKQYGDLSPVYCSPGQLNQVFMQMLKNAIQAIEDVGTITVTSHEDPDWVYVRIHDTGAGIPREELDRIFDFSFHEKTDRVMMRFDLATSYHIIQAHQGDMDIKSEEGKWTEVTIRLPMRKA